MNVRIQDEAGNDILLPHSLSIRPIRYESAAQGGPTWADLRVEGDAVSLWRVLNWLAYRVVILDDRGVKVWWGQINEVDLSTGAISVGVSLDTMANSVAVIWAGGTIGGITDYAIDQDSIDRYGLKQLLISVNGVSEAVAEQRRDWEILRRRYPTPTVSPGAVNRLYASIRCVGWFDTVSRTYYSRDEGAIEYTPSGGVAQRMGWGFTTDELGFTARGRVISDGNAYINSLTAGERFRVSGSSSNNATFTVESSSQRTATDYTASSIAFLQQEKNANNEYIRASHDVARLLNNFNVNSGSVVVTNDGASVTYTESTDYTIDYANGAITALSTGAITNNQILRVTYTYIEYRIEDSNLGLAFVNAGDMIEVAGGSNAGWYRVISTSSEGDRVTVRESVSNEAPGSFITISRGANIVVTTAPTDELPGSTATVYAYGWRIAQAFTVPSDDDWYLYSAEIRAKRVGNPSGSLRVRILTNNSGVPGSSLASSTINGSAVPTEMDWLVFPYDGTLLLESGVTYWLEVDRNAAASPTGYYEIAIDENQQYAGGTMLVSDGTAYQTRPGGGDMPFRLLGREETTDQIVALIGQESEYITGVDLVDESGILTNQFREGDTTALSELLDLLDIGTTNGVRLLATVTPDLVLRIEEEPAQPETPDYQLGLDGRIYTKYGQHIPNGQLDFVGKWISVGAFPPTAEWSHLNPPTPFLVEKAQYDVERMTYLIEPANSDPVWRVGMRLDEG